MLPLSVDLSIGSIYGSNIKTVKRALEFKVQFEGVTIALDEHTCNSSNHSQHHLKRFPKYRDTYKNDLAKYY